LARHKVSNPINRSGGGGINHGPINSQQAGPQSASRKRVGTCCFQPTVGLLTPPHRLLLMVVVVVDIYPSNLEARVYIGKVGWPVGRLHSKSRAFRAY